MLAALKDCGAPPSMNRKDALIGAGLTLGSALVVGTIMVIGSNPVTESIGVVMFPGILTVGTQWMILRGRSRLTQVALIGGTFFVLFLIGLVAGLAQSV